MLWDYAGGNPALALEVWRARWARTPTGSSACARSRSPTPPGSRRCPDSSLFVLRAVLQLAPATVADVAEATRLHRGPGPATPSASARPTATRERRGQRASHLGLAPRRHAASSSAVTSW